MSAPRKRAAMGGRGGKARAKDALRSRTSAMRWRTRWAMRAGAGPMRESAERAKRTMPVTAGAAFGALCGWGVYELLRRRW